MFKLSKKTQRRIQYELEINEVVVWVGQPYPQAFSKSISKPWWFSSWFVFFIFSIAIVFGSLYNILFVVLLFLVVMASRPPLKSREELLNTLYIITNLRALSLGGIGVRAFISYYPRQLKNFEKQQNMDGSGNIIFKTETYIDIDGKKRSRKYGFMAIKDVSRVGDLLEKLAYNKA